MAIEETTKLVVSTIDGDVGRGGWQASGVMINDQAEVEFYRNAIVYVRSEGDGVWEENYRVALDGSIVPNSLMFDRGMSQLDMVISTSNLFLDNAGLQGIYFSEQASPANPHQISNMNLGKIIKHILTEHTNITEETPGGWVDIGRLDTINSTSVDVYTVQQSDSIWQTIQNIAENEFYVRYFTKDDKFVYEPHPQYKASLPSPKIHLTEDNLAGQIVVDYRDRIGVDQMQLYALTDAGQILQSFYPTNIGTEGRRQKIANIRCNSQARLDLLAERSYKFNNRRYNVSLQLAGSAAIALELYDRVSISYTGTSRNGVSINWSEKKFWIETISFSRISNFGVLADLTLAEESL